MRKALALNRMDYSLFPDEMNPLGPAKRPRRRFRIVPSFSRLQLLLEKKSFQLMSLWGLIIANHHPGTHLFEWKEEWEITRRKKHKKKSAQYITK